jgi:hypothetical protein
MTTASGTTAMLQRMDSNFLIACSVCLRVLRGTEWVEAEDAIRDLRTFALPAPPRLESAVCDHCTESIRRRREEPTPTAALAA